MDSLSIDERRASLTQRFATWVPRSLADFLTACAAEHGDRPFVITDERTWTYAEVDAWATRLADGLVARGVGPGDHVAVVLANVPEFVPLKFAIARAGAVAVPLNFLYREDELAYVLAQSRARTLVTMDGFAGLDHLAILDAIAPGWADGRTSVGALRDVVVVPVAGTARAGITTLEDVAAAGDVAAGRSSGHAAAPDAAGDILYTSGTTGSPKGVVVSHDAVLRTAYASALTRAFGDGRRILFSLPCYHMFGYVEGVLRRCSSAARSSRGRRSTPPTTSAASSSTAPTTSSASPR